MLPDTLSHATWRIARDLILCTHARQAQVAALKRLQEAGVRAAYLALEGEVLRWDYDAAHFCPSALDTLQQLKDVVPAPLLDVELASAPKSLQALSSATPRLWELGDEWTAPEVLPEEVRRGAQEVVRALDIRRGILTPVSHEGKALGLLVLWADTLSPDDLPAAEHLGQLLGAALMRPHVTPSHVPASEQERGTLQTLQAILSTLAVDQPLEQSLATVRDVMPQLMPDALPPIFAFRDWEKDEWIWKPLLPDWLKSELLDMLGTAGDWPAVPVEQSRFWEVLARGEPIVTADGGELMEHVGYPDIARDIQRAAGVSCAAVFPMAAEDEVLGLMLVCTRKDTFSNQETNLLKACAASIATVVDNAQDYQKQSRRVQRLRNLEEAAAEILLPRSPAQRNQAIVSVAVRLLDADAAALYTSGEGGQGVTCLASQGLSPRYVRWVSEAYPNLPGLRTESTLLPLRVRDMTADVVPARMREAALEEGLRSMLVLPVAVGGRYVSGLGVYRKRLVPFSDEAVLVGQAYASLCALSQENLRLILESQRQLEVSEALSQVLQDLVTQDDLGLVESTILRHARRITNSDGGILFVWNPAKRALVALSGVHGDKDFSKAIRKPNEGVAGRAFAEDKVIVVDDYEAWDEKPALRSYMPIGPAAAAPIRFEDKPIGALCVVRDIPKPPYQEQDMEILEALAQAVAAVVAQKWHKTDR